MAEDPVYGFNGQDADALIRLIPSSGLGGAGSFRADAGYGDPYTMIGVVATGGITARAGTTPGTGTVNVYHVNDSGVLAHYNSQTITAYNLSSAAIVAGKYVMCKRDYISWKWFVDFEDC
jgi:hypothetical protein